MSEATSTKVAQPMTPADRGAAARTLALAFADDPVMSWLAGRRLPRFTELAPAFFAAQAVDSMRAGSAWTVPGHHVAALWTPPSTRSVTLPSLARTTPAAIRLFGAGRIPVALKALAAMDAKHPREPHWYLMALGTDPAHQSQGWGAVVLQPVLDRCDRDGLPAYLESSNERNVPFYQRQGFEVTGEIELPAGGPTVWPMWRKPR